MKVWKVLFTVVVFALLVSFAPAASAQDPQGQDQPAAQAQSATGKVVNVSPTSITLEVREQGQPKTIEFVIDSNTKVEGKVAKDGMAHVTFRTENGRHIATAVRASAA
jgi:hypothetical protein